MLSNPNSDQYVPRVARYTLVERSSAHRPPPRLLAVDNESLARKFLTLILGPPAFHCITACRGEEALVILERERFDGVISDLNIPGIGGMGF